MMVEKDNVIYFLERPIQVVRKFRARRLTISIRPERPARLTVNLTTTSREILQFLENHTSWLQKNFEKIEALEVQYQKPKLQPGQLFPFLGELKYFSFTSGSRLRPWFEVDGGFLVAHLPEGQTSENFSVKLLELALQNFYKQQGIAYLQKRMSVWIDRTGLKPMQIKFNRATTRWGSCNSKKHINMNWKLICHAPHLVDYVIVHELCHLKHLNHSEQFWDLVSEYMPEYRVYEKVLDEQTQISRFLNAR